MSEGVRERRVGQTWRVVKRRRKVIKMEKKVDLFFVSVSSLDTQNNVNDLDPNIDPTLLKMNDDEIEGN